MFELYNKGYSQRRVLLELRALGYQGSAFLTQRNIHNRAYCGKGTEKGIFYPAIVSEQVFDEAQRLSTSKRHNVVSMSRDVLCRQLILCQDCGHYYGIQTELYRCANGAGKGRNTDVKCSNTCGISVKTLDKFIWSICAEEYITLLVRTRKDNKRRKNEENDILTRKAKKLQEDIDSNNEKKETLLNNYINGDITKNQYDKSLNKLASVISEKNNELASIRARINDNRMEEEMILDSQQFTRKKMRDIEQMPQTDCARASRIVHKVIKKIELEKASFVDKKVIIYYNDGRIERYEYKPKKVFFEDKFKLISEQ